MLRRVSVNSAALGVLAASLIAGCEAGSGAGRQLLFFPPPPAEPRVQFLTWASGEAEVGTGLTSFQEFVLGKDEVDQRTLNKPYGIAARDGAVYVCDTKGLSLAKLDFKNQAFSVLGTRGPGRLRKPINVIIDPLGYKFVTDPKRKQIVVFGPEDKYVTAFNIPEPCHPVDVALYENELYVLDNDSTPRVLVLDRRTGDVIRSFGSRGKEPGQFNIPSSISIGPDGNLYVSDTMNFRIQKLTRKGKPLWAKGTAGYRPGQFGRPRGIRVGPDGVVYVADAASEVVQMFNSDGQMLMHLGGPGNTPGTLVLPSSLGIDAGSVAFFQKYIHKKFKVEYLLFVASQYGRHLISVYAFGSFPEGYQLSESQIATLPELEPVVGQEGLRGPAGSQDEGNPKEDSSDQEQD